MIRRAPLLTLALLALAAPFLVTGRGQAGTELLYADATGDCGGLTPCFPTINAALAAAVAPAEVRVFPGTYTESVFLANVSPQGDIIMRTVDSAGEPAPGTATVHTETGPAIHNGVPYSGAITIDGFVVQSDTDDGVRLETSTKPITVRNVTADDQGDGQAFVPDGSEPPGTGDDGIDITTDTGDITIENVSANGNEGPSSDGIDIYTTTGSVTITGAEANDNIDPLRTGTNVRRADGIDIDTEGGSVELTDAMATGNANNGITVATATGHHFIPSGNISVASAVASTNGANGLDAATGVNFGDGGTATVVDSTFEANGETGALLDGVDGAATVTGSTAMGNEGAGFVVREVMGDALVQESHSDANGGEGFVVADSIHAYEHQTATVEDSSATGNESEGFRIEFGQTPGQAVVVRRSTADGNSQPPGTSPNLAGIAIESSGSATVEEFTATGNAGAGIVLTGLGQSPLMAATVRDSLVTDNLGRGVALASTDVAGAFAVNSNVICGNTPEVSFAGAMTVDATGNLWTGLNPPQVEDIDAPGAAVDTEPYMDTMSVRYSPDLPFVVGHPTTIELTLYDGARTVALQTGPGDPNGGGPVEFDTDNGLLHVGQDSGLTVHAAFSGGSAQVQLVPAQAGVANVALEAPCLQDVLITGEVVEPPPKGDTDCSGAVALPDLMRALNYAAGLPVEEIAECEAADGLFELDCVAGATGRDVLPLALFLADLPPLPGDCPPVG